MDRFFHNDNASFVDLSYQLDDYRSSEETISYVSAEDKLYIGSRYPFNSKYLKVSTANAVSANLTVKYWDGNQFRDVVEIIDETAISGVPLAQSGHITFVPDKDYTWTREDTEDIPALSSITIYDMFWLEISYDADISAGIKWMGDIFCKTNDLAAEYPDLLRSAVLTAFESGKSDWEEQIMFASRLVVEELISRRVIDHGNQLLDRRKLRSSAVAKTAEIVYSGLGDDFEDQRAQAQANYANRLKQDILNLDTNLNARLEVGEGSLRQGRLSR